MRAVVQRVISARVIVDGRQVAAVEHGLLAFIGIARDDDADDVAYVAKKMVELRVFADAAGRFNRSVLEVEGTALLVSQFTLYGDCRRGRRPSFDQAASSVDARALYEAVAETVRGHGVPVQTGVFQKHMRVESVNDGPVTILVDSGKAF